jgi:Group II intron, maturase-specific domain
MRDRLNRLLHGWSEYFGYGTQDKAYKAVDHHVCGRVRHFLSRRHKVPNRGTRRFPHDTIYGGLMSGEGKRGWLNGLLPHPSSTLLRAVLLGIR